MPLGWDEIDFRPRKHDHFKVRIHRGFGRLRFIPVMSRIRMPVIVCVLVFILCIFRLFALACLIASEMLQVAA